MGLKTAGKLLLDDGAIDAIISKGKSLLPSGIQSIEGRFAKGQQVECVSISTGKSIARGLTSYSSDELEKIRVATELKREYEAKISQGIFARPILIPA